MNIQMIKKIQKLQKEMQVAQESVYQSVFSSSANNLVTVEVKGDKTIDNIIINEKVELEDVELLADAIKIAINNAFKNIDDELEEKMAKYTKIAGLGF